jgi:nucleoside-diphosphate-sugar epimerase
MGSVLVTGANGFIGTQLVEALVGRGQNVACLVRQPLRADHLKSFAVRLVAGDVTEPASLKRAFAQIDGQFDVVYHVAGLTRARNRAEFFRVNETGTRHVLDACLRATTPPTVLLLSSLAAAGPSLDGRARTEADPALPRSNYGRSKRAGELAAIARSAEIPITIVRPPIVLGAGDITGLAMFRTMARRGLHLVATRKAQRFSIVHVADLVAGLMLAAERGARLAAEPRTAGDDSQAASATETSADQGYYYLTDPATPTFSELGRMIAAAVGRPRFREIRFPPAMVWSVAAVIEGGARLRRKASYLGLDKVRDALAGDWTCSAVKATAELGFAPGADLEQRLCETADWYRRAGWL